MAGPTPSVPKRVDARRNRERLLASARQVFLEQGTDASLRDVARRADVGIATLYRHFPTREALLEAVLRGRLDTLRTTADELAGDPSPGGALTAWLGRFAESAGAWHGLPATVMAALRDDGSELHASCAALQEAAGRLLCRAQETGAARVDLRVEDLFAAAAAVGWLAEHAGHEPAARVLALLGDGVTSGPREPSGSP